MPNMPNERMSINKGGKEKHLGVIIDDSLDVSSQWKAVTNKVIKYWDVSQGHMITSQNK